MFPAITYRDWRRQRAAEAEADLVSTTLNRPEADSDGIVPRQLRNLDPPDEELTVRELIAREYDVAPGQVAVTCRCQHANFLVTAAEFGRLDGSDGETPRALIESPTYEPLERTPVGIGFEVDRFERRATADYALDPDVIAGKIDDGTELLVLTNRHNPSGQLTERETLEAVARLAAERDVTVMVDEVYAPFVTHTPDAPRTAFGGATAAGLPNVVVTNSLTKFHGLYDVNIGWVIADHDRAERVRRTEEHTNAVARPNLEMAKRALANPDRFRERSRALIERRHRMLVEFVERRNDIDGSVRSDVPFAFVEHDRADGDAVDQRAIQEGVMVVPGRLFGDSRKFRVSLGYGRGANRDALRRLGRALDTL